MTSQAWASAIALATLCISGCSGSSGGSSGGVAGATGSGGASGTAGTSGASGASGTAGTSGAAGATGAAGAAVADAGSADARTDATGAGSAGSSGTAGAAPCPAGVSGHCNGDTGAKDKYAGFTLALAEEFDTPIDLDHDPTWTWSDGGPPDGQARFQKKAITFAGGLMIITATAETALQSSSYAEPSYGEVMGTVPSRAVSSGELRTKYNNYRYGRYEVKLRAPKESSGADGNYIASMFAFRTPKWQEWTEVDIELEANIKHAIAYNVINADARQTYPGDKAAAGSVSRGNDFTILDAHVYAFEWTPTAITWYVDGVMFHSYPGDGAAVIPTKSAKIMMNLWVFASAAAYGNPANNAYPIHSEYDYVRFYKWNQETTYPVADPKTLSPEDLDFSRNNASEMYP